MEAPPASYGKRGARLQDTVRDLQILIGDLLYIPPVHRVRLIRRFISQLVMPDRRAAPASSVDLRRWSTGAHWEAGRIVRRSAVTALGSMLDGGVGEVPGIAAPVAMTSVRGDTAVRVQRFIDANLTRHFTLREIARETGVPARRVNACLRAAIGLSARQYMLRQRFQRIVEALTSSELKIEAIGLDVGYQSKKDLYRLVRRFTGLTPSRLRALAHAREGGKGESDS